MAAWTGPDGMSDLPRPRAGRGAARGAPGGAGGRGAAKIARRPRPPPGPPPGAPRRRDALAAPDHADWIATWEARR